MYSVLVYTSSREEDERRNSARWSAEDESWAARRASAIASLMPEAGWSCCPDCDIDPELLDHVLCSA